MSPFREPPEAAESQRVIYLPRAHAKYSARETLALLLVALPSPVGVPAFIGFDAFDANRGWLVAWGVSLLVAPVIAARVWRRGSVFIGSRSFTRVGLLRDHTLPWREVADGVEAAPAGVLGDAPQAAGQTVEDEIGRAQLLLRDPQGELQEALDNARRGELHVIRERVEARGRPLRRWWWYVAPFVVLLAFTLSLSGLRVAFGPRRMASECAAAVQGHDATSDVLRTLCLVGN